MADAGLDSSMHVAVKTLPDFTVQGPPPSRLGAFARAQFADRQLWRLQRSPRKTWRSPARFGCLSADSINASDADVVNLHWVTDGFLSVKEIGKITKPLVWSLYDTWPMAGTEHYGDETTTRRIVRGYDKESRPPDETGFDLDRSTWQLKSDHWRAPVHVVAASQWLTDLAEQSALFRSQRVSRIPHPVDGELFTPLDAQSARTRLGLPRDRPLVLFLASAGITDARKGWDLLNAAMAPVHREVPDVQVVVLGPRPQPAPAGLVYPVTWGGEVHDDQTLALYYGAASVVAVPSRQDNMPLTAMEAASAGRAVVGFRIGGLPDIVRHEVTGYLAAPFDVAELSHGLVRSLREDDDSAAWAQNARTQAAQTWEKQVVVREYLEVYESICS